ncbi:arylesterase [Uliginosibacterium paludis]|uniref:Arylesterase n=1 Tax=Uliginosibacterium paludis TaxID=1615952 RepID=A0ABV2CKT1_9RHOO
MSRFLFILLAVFSFQTASAAGILVWGDSLSAGYGIPQDKAWPKLLATRLASEGYKHEISNASISGETTAGGLARLPEALSRIKPAVVIIELGANDGLRGLPVKAMQGNLDAMIRLATKANARVLLVGMRMPPNFGPVYTQKFQQVFTDLAAQHRTALVPFMMEGFAGRSELFQNDNLHPTAEAQSLVLDNIWPALKPLLGKR